MPEYRVQRVPEPVVQADSGRFGEFAVNTVAQVAQLDIDSRHLHRYLYWWGGSDRGWKLSWFMDSGRRGHGGITDHWREEPGDEWVAYLGDHLAAHGRHGRDRPSLHMRCKEGRWHGKPYHWTRYLAVDLDADDGGAQSLNRRYDQLLEAFDATPVVLQSPRSGRHVLIPLREPVSVFGFNYGGCQRDGTPRQDGPSAVKAALEAAELRLAQGRVELRPTHRRTCRLPLGPGTCQLDPGTLVPLQFSSREEQIALLVDAMDQAAAHSPLDALALGNRAFTTSSRLVGGGKTASLG